MDKGLRDSISGFASFAKAVGLYAPPSSSPTPIGPWNMSLLTSVVERGDKWTTEFLVTQFGVDPNHIVMNGVWTYESETFNVEDQGKFQFSSNERESYERESHWPNIGNTAVLTAICQGNTSMVRLLSDLGANINLESPKKVKFVFELGSLKKTDVLLTHSPLLLAIEREDANMVREILDIGGDPTTLGWMKTRDNLFVRGNALQLAKLRFEGRYPETTQSLITTFENIIKERNLRSVIEYKEKLDLVTQELSKTKGALAQMNSIFQRMKKSLECNICIDVPDSTCKIFSCLNGHAICELCLRRIVECPLCKQSFRKASTVRLRIAESIVSDVASLNLHDPDDEEKPRWAFS